MPLLRWVVMSLTSDDLPEQLTLWNSWYARSGASGDDRVHRELREMFLDRLPRRRACRVLDLGCGAGHDLRAMAAAGHRVAGVDFSPTAIDKARTAPPRRRWWQLRRAAVDLRVHDVAEGLPYPAGAFHGVFSHLALHYFRDHTTRKIFKEVARVLRPGGLFVFSVKSTKDRCYGKGEQLGEHIYSYNGHVRHFFDEAYVVDLLAGWNVEVTEAYEGSYASTDPSAFIRAVAWKKTPPPDQAR